MAGGYEQIVDRNGRLAPPGFVAAMLDNDANVYETVEELFGMIWYLADLLVGSSTGYSDQSEDISRWKEEVKAAVEEAHEHHLRGLHQAKEINR